MAITYSAALGTHITSALIGVSSLATQTGGTNQVQIPATAGDTSPSSADNYNGNVGNGSNGLGDTYVGRTCVLRAGTGTMEIKSIISASYASNVVTLTVSGDWASAPTSGNTFDICYEPGDIEDGGAGGGINLNAKTGLYELSNALTIDSTGFLQIRAGNALELDDSGSSVAFIVSSGGWFIAGYPESGADLSGGIMPSYNNTATEPSTQIQSGGHAYIYDTLIWAQLVSQQFECANGSDCLFSRVKFLNQTNELHLYDAEVYDSSISGKGSSTEIIRVDAGTIIDGLVVANVDTLDSVADTTTETLTLKNVIFTNVTDYINVRNNKTWNVINPTWNVSTYTDFVWVGTTSNQINERYSLEIVVQQADGTPISSPRAFVYRGQLDAASAPALDIDTTGDSNGVVDTTWIYKSFITNSNLDTYTDHALRVYYYGRNPFVATITDNAPYIGSITLTTDTNITESSQSSALTAGSSIVVSRHATGETDSNPIKVLKYDGGTGGTPGVGNTVTQGSATGVVVEYIGDAVSGTIVLKNWNGTEFTDNQTITDTGTFSATTDTAGFYQEYTWLVECNALALTTVYDYLAAKMAQSTLDTTFDKVHEWGADEQAQLMYNTTSGYTTLRNATKTEGVWLSNKGSGTIAYMTSDAGTQYVPPVQYTFTLSNLDTGSVIRIFQDDGNPKTDPLLAETDNSGTSFAYNYIYGGSDVDIYVVVISMTDLIQRLPYTLSNANQTQVNPQSVDRVYKT